ncbi:MAG: hypothetical protein R2827_16235 [Bdellovibrionales bacterium]
MAALFTVVLAFPVFAVERLTTRELSEHLEAIATHQKENEYVIDESKAALGLGLEVYQFIESGGFFGSQFDHPADPSGQTKIKFQDNKFTYLWSMEASNNRRIEGEGYVNIIAQFTGEDQPELLKYVKEGDVVVYWHPEYRANRMDEYQQWRATHAATIVEVQRDGETRIATTDIPAGYARPFDGSTKNPAHVFRYVARDAAGNIVENVEDYGKQIARWATMAFGRFSFNGDYGSMTVRNASDLKGFAKEYLNPNGEIPDMYCAWYAFTNVNLGVMCPVGSNCIEQNFPDEYEALSSSDKPFSYVGRAGSRGYSKVLYGEGSWDDYSAGSSYQPNFNKFAIEPLTAQNLLMNFLDRVIGTDIKAAQSPQTWVPHAKFKAGVLQQQKTHLWKSFAFGQDV